MVKVYVVVFDTAHGTIIEGTFSSWEKANDYITTEAAGDLALKDLYYICEHVLDMYVKEPTHGQSKTSSEGS